jgi:hypothetical protein
VRDNSAESRFFVSFSWMTISLRLSKLEIVRVGEARSSCSAWIS